MSQIRMAALVLLCLMSAVAVASACPGGTHPCGVVSCCKD